MKEDKIIANVYETKNYDMFNKLLGNRDVTEKRIQKIINSIIAVGYVLSPICINMKHEIVDGQGRLEALKRLDMPIHYVIDPNAGLEQCIKMNISGTPWGLVDYINCYASQGNENYNRIQEFLAKYPAYTISVKLWALFHSDESNCTERIQNGTAIVTQQMMDEAIELIEYWNKFSDIHTNRRKEFLEAIGYCYMLDCVDNETLVRKLHQTPRAFEMIATVTDAIDAIEDSYNKRLRDSHVYIETEYFKYLDSKSAGLGSIAKKRRGDI